MNKEKIKIDLNVMNGNPFLIGTILTVFDIVYSCQIDGLSVFFENYPNVSQDDVREVFNYCKNRKCDGVNKSRVNSCTTFVSPVFQINRQKTAA
jgi:uncharacterized protein (DUF433 family)